MNKTATQPLTTLASLINTQEEATNLPFFTQLEPLDTANTPTFQELLEQYTATTETPESAWNRLTGDESYQPAPSNVHLVQTLADGEAGLAPTDNLASASDHASAPETNPFAFYETNLANATPQPVRWLWHKRVPLVGITSLDGDHGTGRSILALQLAACVSSGTPMLDGTPTTEGSVIIITPHTDANTTQIQRLIALGANLSNIQILSYVHDPETASHPSGYRPISLPEDLDRIFDSVKRLNARLIIFDLFMDTLSYDKRWTKTRLSQFLDDLDQRLIEHNVACLLVRNCPAKGGHARPSVLERSEHFANIAASQMLLAPDPMHPDRLLLSHVRNRHSALTPTLTLQIQSHPDNPDLPHITVLGNHSLQAKDFLSSRPETLHRQLLSQHLLQIITTASDPVPVATLCTLSPHSSAFQIQRSLNDLLRMGQIQRPTRGFYTLTPTPPQPERELTSSAATTSTSETEKELTSSAAITSIVEPERELTSSATTTSIVESEREINPSAAITSVVESERELNFSATTISISEPERELKPSAVITSIAEPENELKSSTAITLKPKTAKHPYKGHRVGPH